MFPLYFAKENSHSKGLFKIVEKTFDLKNVDQ